MDFLSEFFLLFLIDSVTCEWTTSQGGKNSAIRCLDERHRDGDITNLLMDVTTSETIDAFCKRQSELQKCIAENIHHLTVAEDTAYQQKTFGVHQFYLNVCPPGSNITSDYRKNAHCFRRNKNKILSCGSDLPDIGTYRMINSPYFRCCALETYKDCLKRVFREERLGYCGEEAERVIEQIVKRYFKQQFDSCGTVSLQSCGEGRSTQDWTTVPRGEKTSRKWYTQTNWHFNRRNTEKEDWYPTTVEDEEQKRKCSDAMTVTANVICLITSVGMILFHRFNKL